MLPDVAFEPYTSDFRSKQMEDINKRFKEMFERPMNRILCHELDRKKRVPRSTESLIFQGPARMGQKRDERILQGHAAWQKLQG